MRPLPRIHAVTDADVLALDDLGVRAAAIASLGPAAALHVRDRNAPAAPLAAIAMRFVALARAPEAAVFINARPDLAAAVGAQGLQLGATDLTVADARSLYASGWIGRSVHSLLEAEQALAEGADYLMVGNVYGTPSHADATPAGTGLLRQVVALGRPVIAIGGVSIDRVRELHDAGAWGVAAIRALWHAADSAAAARALAAPWMEGA